MRITGNLHQRDLWAWYREITDMARSRVEATDMVGAHLSEPDHPLLVYGNAKGKERLYTPFGCKRIVEYEAGVGIESSQGVGVEFGEPDIAMGVQRQIIRRTGQR